MQSIILFDGRCMWRNTLVEGLWTIARWTLEIRRLSSRATGSVRGGRIVLLAPERALGFAKVVENHPAGIELQTLIVIHSIGLEARPDGGCAWRIGIAGACELRPIRVHRV